MNTKKNAISLNYKNQNNSRTVGHLSKNSIHLTTILVAAAGVCAVTFYNLYAHLKETHDLSGLVTCRLEPASTDCWPIAVACNLAKTRTHERSTVGCVHSASANDMQHMPACHEV